MVQTLAAPRNHSTRLRRKPANPLELRVRQSLCNSPYRHLQEVRCHCGGGVVVLTGILPSFFLKQMAQETVKRFIGVMEIDNRVEVIYTEETAR